MNEQKIISRSGESVAHIDAFLLQIKNKSDRLMDYFLAGYFIVGLLLSFYYDTWKIGIGVGGLSLIAYYSVKLALPDSNLYQYVLSIVLGIFMAQYIYQMHGLFEMHFIAFVGSTMLITYQKWKLQIPLALVVIIHHAIFGYLQYIGYTKIYFTQLDYMTLQTFIIHGILATIIFYICGLWAHHFRKYSERHIQQTFEMGRLQEEKFHREAMERQQEELRQINEELTQQAEELRASEEELKTQEEELRQINADMHQKTEIIELAQKALRKKAEELEASGKYKSEFLANMSHELRTPLNSVLILANLLKDNKLNNLTDKQIQYAGIIHKSGNDLLNLINDILDLSKIEAGKVEMLFEEIKIKDIANDIELLFSELANEKKIRFSTVIQPDIPVAITTDRQRIEQVIKNLLSNAFKFTPGNGKVILGFALQNDHLAISVTDTGIGILPEKQQLIFEAFQQADGSTSRKFGGTGLGLSISKELIKRLQGEIRIFSKPGEGSVFTLLLPLKIIPAPQDQTNIAHPAQSAVYNPENVKEQTLVQDDKTAIKPGEQSILIIEDDDVFANHLKDFAHSKGYKTIIAISGDEGLFYAAKYKPVAIILDFGLPVVDGRNVLKILKSDPNLKHIPVHVITADDRIEVSDNDIENYFQKPLRPGDLELAFSSIESYIKEKYRNILVLFQKNAAMRSMLERLISEKNAGVVFDTVSTNEEAIAVLTHKKVDCMIVDIGAEINNGIETLRELRKFASADAYTITCLEGNISTNDEKQIKTYSDSIIRKSTHSTDRLLDEVALFLHKIKDSQHLAVPFDYKKEFEKNFNGKKVLLADDDMRNIFSVSAMLQEHGMEVVTSENGREALEMLALHDDVDIVLMDIMMPEMDGYETMQHIRAGGKYRKLPIIALTAKAMIGDREKCIEAGASDYITKPIDNNKLFSLMRVWLSQ